LQSDRILVIGAGLSGATMARVLAESGFDVAVMERLDHPGGHCHSYRDAETGVMLHAHGPHILHSDNAEVWAFAQRFAVLKPYVHTVLAVTGGRKYQLPITLPTIRQFFGRDFNSQEAEDFIVSLGRRSSHQPRNFEEQGRSLVGDALYEAFFDGYTRKQWGIEPRHLPASIMRRIPVRFSDDPSYYRHSRVAIPEAGYTAMAEAILNHPAITVTFGAVVDPIEATNFRHTIYTGPIDAWFGYRFGRLAYRTLDFNITRAAGTFQEVAQVNYCDMSVPWTRITEYKHFTPWERHDRTVYVTETSRDCGPDDAPYYPLRLADDEPLAARYLAVARTASGVSFVGRLATYRYIDMDVAIAEALAAGHRVVISLKAGDAPAALFVADDGADG
jgi:UDP-galactopyranose mutase